MKNIITLTSVFLGSSLIASDIHYLPSPASIENKHLNNKNANPADDVYIIIDKSDYELSIYDEKGWYATYPVVFGNNKLEDKKMEGDRNTPEGTFRITSKRIDDKWYRFMSIDYPNEESKEKFRERKERGEIPAGGAGGPIRLRRDRGRLRQPQAQ